MHFHRVSPSPTACQVTSTIDSVYRLICLSETGPRHCIFTVKELGGDYCVVRVFNISNNVVIVWIVKFCVETSLIANIYLFIFQRQRSLYSMVGWLVVTINFPLPC